jgi:hypothetical protein
VTDIPTYTVCALLRDDDPPQRWSGATWTTEAADAGMAVALCEMEARKEVSTDGRLICRGLALACVHPGNIDRAGVIWSATEEFTVGQVEYERDRHPLGLFTVCGLDWPKLPVGNCCTPPPTRVTCRVSTSSATPTRTWTTRPPCG